MQLTISHNFPDVARRLDSMRQEVRDKALVSAVNKTIEQGRTQMIREIASDYMVTASYVRERLRIKRASARQGRLQIEATLDGSNGKKRSANMIRFLERKTTMAEARRRGKAGTLNQLFFKVKRSGGKKAIAGAFIGNKGRTVFMRDGKARLPIHAVQTIDVPQMFNQKRINAAVVAALIAKFPAIFEREAAFYLRRFGEGK